MAGPVKAGLRGLGKPIRTVLRWQLIATVLLTLLVGALAGTHGALSAALGGGVSILAGWASATVAGTACKGDSAAGVLVTALKAEAVKLGLIGLLLAIVFFTYAEVVVPVFLGSFIVTVLIFSMAFFVREHNQPRT
jgi:ATP synthase protein I